MATQTDFNSFISNIEPKKSTIEYVSSIQNNIRDFLSTHETYSDIYDNSFLSGSYAKHTCIRPSCNDKKRDVDIIVVTNHTINDDSKIVLYELFDALVSSSKYSTAQIQHHSIGIEMSQVSIDVVPVISDEDDPDLYYICDSFSGNWTLTDPKGHKSWSTEVNQSNNNMYKPLVKIFKWWRKVNCPTDTKYPKGIVLEKIIADNLGNSDASTESLFIETINKIIQSYKETYVDIGKLPIISDPSVKNASNNLLSSYSFYDFSAFIDKLIEHTKLINRNGTTNDTWREILGNEFPQANDDERKSFLSEFACTYAKHRQKSKWPFQRGYAAMIALRAEDTDGSIIPYESNGKPLKKGINLHFRALTSAQKPYTVMWQITNTGEEAKNAGCLRGDFYSSDEGLNGRHEQTSYTGSHAVQCYIIKNNICIAKSKDYIINIR